jgi:hypothetical protein
MRRVELLIEQSRRATESQNFSEEAGIQDSEFLEYLNNAQDRIFSRILSTYPDEFLAEDEQDAIIGTESYSIPSDAFMKTKVKTVEYSQSGQARDYYFLDQSVLRERYHGTSGNPCAYIRRNNKVLLQPAPSTAGSIRICYTRKINRLDKRRGTVSAVTLDSGTKTITSLTLDTTNLSANDIEDIEALGYICVVDKDGVIQMKDIPVSDIDQDTGLITLDGSFTYVTGETIAVGNYIVMGKNTSTHSELDDSCERYLIAHCDWKVLKRDSSQDSIEQSSELNDILSEIVDSYKDVDDDVDLVPILDTEYFSS